MDEEAFNVGSLAVSLSACLKGRTFLCSSYDRKNRQSCPQKGTNYGRSECMPMKNQRKKERKKERQHLCIHHVTREDRSLQRGLKKIKRFKPRSRYGNSMSNRTL